MVLPGTANRRVGCQLKIVFISAELARVCNDDRARERAYGMSLALMLRQRLGEMSAAADLAELRRLPASRLRLDPARGAGSLLIALGHDAELRVRPRYNPLPILPDGRLNEAAVRELLVTGVVPAA